MRQNLAGWPVDEVVGTRPSFMKVATVISALGRRPADCPHLVVHTGEHCDDTLSRSTLCSFQGTVNSTLAPVLVAAQLGIQSDPPMSSVQPPGA